MIEQKCKHLEDEDMCDNERQTKLDQVSAGRLSTTLWNPGLSETTGKDTSEKLNLLLNSEEPVYILLSFEGFCTDAAKWFKIYLTELIDSLWLSHQILAMLAGNSLRGSDPGKHYNKEPQKTQTKLLYTKMTNTTLDFTQVSHQQNLNPKCLGKNTFNT